MIQNAAARLVFNEPKRTHVTPLFISLHWLLVAARIKFKTLMLAYRTATGSAPSYFHSLLRIYIYIYAFSRCFYPKRLTVHSGNNIFFLISMCVPWELNPQPFALLTKCSTTEPQNLHPLQKSDIR